MQQAIGDQLGQQHQPTMVQQQSQLVQQQQQQQHLVQQQQMLQPQQQMLQQQPQLLQQQQILQSQQQMMQPQQQILQGQQQMLQGQQQVQMQMMPQQLGQQMMYCPTVRFVYDTPVLMQGDQIQQQNQGLFVNQPPWARPVQNQVIYVQQIGSNLVPVQHLDPNIYLHQNLPMYQQLVQNVPQLVQNLPQNVQQGRIANNITGLVQNFGANVQNVQDQNVAHLQNLGFIQTNQNVNNANVNVVNNEERRLGSPMNQQNAQNQDQSHVYRQIVTQPSQPQVRPILQMANQVQNIPTSVQIGQQNSGQNTHTNVRQINNNIAQNLQTSGHNVRQMSAQTPPTPTSMAIQNSNQNIRIVNSNVGTHVTSVAQNINANMPQVRHVMPQAVNFTPRGVQQQNLQNVNSISTVGNISTVTYSAVRNGQPYTYRAIQPKPNANIRNYTTRPQSPMVRKPVPNLIQTSTANTNTVTSISAPSTFVKTETESPVFNKKRKSESPDETQKKVSNFGSVTVTSQVKDKTKTKYGVHTSEIGVNTSPVHKPKTPADNQTQPVLQINPMEAKIKQEVLKPPENSKSLPSLPILHANLLKPTFCVKTEVPVDGMIQQTITQVKYPTDWYGKYHTDPKQDSKQNNQTASQQTQQPISQQPISQQMTTQQATIQPMIVQQPTSQQMMTQQATIQPMIVQQPTSQQMTIQQSTGPQLTMQPPTSQQMTIQPPMSQQTIQQPISQPVASPQRTKKDMSQQTEEKLVRKTVFPQATTRGRLLDDKTNLNAPKVEEPKPSIVSNNTVNPQVTNTISTANEAPTPDVPHIPIKPIEPTKKVEEKRIKTEEVKLGDVTVYIPVMPTAKKALQKVAPIKNEIGSQTEPTSEPKKVVKRTTHRTTISDSLKEIIRDTIAKKEEIKTETDKSIPSQSTEIETSTKVVADKAKTKVKIENPAPLHTTDVPKSLDSIQNDIKVPETKISTDFEEIIKDTKIEKKEYKNISINEMTGKEIHIVDGNIHKERKEKDYILTHVLDGFVIQESNVPFAVRRPLKEKTVNSVLEEKERQDPSMKNLTKEEMKDKILELSQLHLEDGREKREAERKNEPEEAIKEENNENQLREDLDVDVEQKDNPFKDLEQNVVKSWTVEDLTSHLAKHNWVETVSLLQEHEIDGESLFLVTKSQLVTIGLNDAHAEVICDFVGNKN